MDMISKVALMGVLQSPMWKLSPDQLTRIEAILDGARVPRAKPAAPTILSYEEAAERLGLRAKNRAKTVALWVRLGKLDALRPSGKKAVGVTVESVERLAASHGAAADPSRNPEGKAAK